MYTNIDYSKDYTHLFEANSISTFLNGYYEKIAKLINLGVLCFTVTDNQSETEVTSKHLDEYFHNPDSYKNKITGMKKLSGVIAAEYFREQIDRILKNYPDYKISNNNVYVEGCHIEFDFLILKANAEMLEGLPVYKKDDVVAVLECKTNGVYTLFNDPAQIEKFDLERFANAYINELKGPQRGIKLGYMTMSENCPLSESASSNFIRGTVNYMTEKFGEGWDSSDRKWNCFFARCHYTAKRRRDIYMSDSQWEDFVLSLIKD